MATGRELAERQQIGNPSLWFPGQLDRRARSAARSSFNSDPIQVLDPSVDTRWGMGTSDQEFDMSACDYCLTGEDVFVYVDGIENEQIPMVFLAFNISQNKRPVYGYASHSYDAVMRGNRIVTGRMGILTVGTKYMTNLLAKAAQERTRQKTDYPIRGLDSDEANVDKYWKKNIDPATLGYKHIHSVHPPFNLVIVYGVQSTSAYANNPRLRELCREIHNGHPLYSSHNEKTIASDPLSGGNRRILESVEITSMATQYTPEGDAQVEVYEFFARDVYLP
jgi:hypothetical protein